MIRTMGATTAGTGITEVTGATAVMVRTVTAGMGETGTEVMVATAEMVAAMGIVGVAAVADADADVATS